MRKVYIHNIQNSHLGNHIYIVYDRFFNKKEQYLWLGTEHLDKQIPETIFFISEEEAREWIDDNPFFFTNSSIIYIIELPPEMSTIVLLSNDRSAKLQELLTIDVIENLWQEQYDQKGEG